MVYSPPKTSMGYVFDARLAGIAKAASARSSIVMGKAQAHSDQRDSLQNRKEGSTWDASPLIRVPFIVAGSPMTDSSNNLPR